jgi:hypothetical protein
VTTTSPTTSGPPVTRKEASQSPIEVSNMTVPSRGSSATRYMSPETKYSLSWASAIERRMLDELVARLPGRSRTYSQIRSPVAAFSAWMRSPWLWRYMTPSYTSGVVSWRPSVMFQAHASRSSPTLSLLIWSSGL